MPPSVLPTDTSCVELASLSWSAAMIAGAVAAAAASWMAKRNGVATVCFFLIGVLGGLSIGTGMGRILYVTGDVSAHIATGDASLRNAAVAGFAGAAPTAFIMAAVTTFMLLRHVHPRPSPQRVGWLACAYGTAAGVALACLRTLLGL